MVRPVSRQPDWSGAGNRDDRKQILSAGASASIARGGPENRRAWLSAPRSSRLPRPRIHEGMDRGAVGLAPNQRRGKDRGTTS